MIQKKYGFYASGTNGPGNNLFILSGVLYFVSFFPETEMHDRIWGMGHFVCRICLNVQRFST